MQAIPTDSVVPLVNLIEAGRELDELIIRPSGLTHEQLSILLDELSVLPIDIWLSTNDDALDVPIYRFGRVGGSNLMQVRVRPIGGWGLVTKQLFDYTFASIGLLVSVPLFLAIAVAIKLDSPGPVFFRQRRHGCNEREIVVFKFRTMTVTEEGDNVKQATRTICGLPGLGACCVKLASMNCPSSSTFCAAKCPRRAAGQMEPVQTTNTIDRASRRYSNRHRLNRG